MFLEKRNKVKCSKIKCTYKSDGGSVCQNADQRGHREPRGKSLHLTAHEPCEGISERSFRRALSLLHHHFTFSTAFRILPATVKQ